MAWGVKRGADDLVEKVKRNDSKMETLYIMSTRNFGTQSYAPLVV